MYILYISKYTLPAEIMVYIVMVLYLKQGTKWEKINTFGYIKIYNSAQQKTLQ